MIFLFFDVSVSSTFALVTSVCISSVRSGDFRNKNDTMQAFVDRTMSSTNIEI